MDDFSNKPLFEKCISLILSFTNHLLSLIDLVVRVWHKLQGIMEPLTDSSNIDVFHHKLVLGLHGRNSSPYQLKEIFDEAMKIENTDIDSSSSTSFHIPYIKDKGDAELDEMVQIIFNSAIKPWNDEGEDKELVLVGISNGGRIARALEAKLKDLEKCNITKIRYISIVGANKGSSLVNLVNYIPFSWLFMSKAMADEMPVGSERNLQLDMDYAEALQKMPDIEREYTFIASPHDWMVPDEESTLMDVGAVKAKYAIVPRHGHNSIVKVTAKVVAQMI
ncbi:MAG: hypothetical protein H0T62_05510 [Parachlamydiaceae bacterium]|nr:hypothetical protein [Parachlamydiaceae bacterium]